MKQKNSFILSKPKRFSFSEITNTNKPVLHWTNIIRFFIVPMRVKREWFSICHTRVAESSWFTHSLVYGYETPRQDWPGFTLPDNQVVCKNKWIIKVILLKNIPFLLGKNIPFLGPLHSKLGHKFSGTCLHVFLTYSLWKNALIYQNKQEYHLAIRWPP